MTGLCLFPGKLDIHLKAKDVTIHEFEFTNINLPEIDFRVVCTKGTYIRSLAYDFGRFLNNGAHLSALHRTRIGEYSIKDALNLDQLEFLLNTENE